MSDVDIAHLIIAYVKRIVFKSEIRNLKSEHQMSDVDIAYPIIAYVNKSTNAFNAYYKAGLDGTRLDFLEKYVSPEYKGVFNEDTKKKIYEYGKLRQEKRQARKSKGKGNVRWLDKSIANDIPSDAEVWTEINLLGYIAPLMNIDVVMYADETGDNGRYNPNTDEIEVNIKGEYTLLQTLSHELVHFMEETNPKAYKELVDFVVNAYGEGDTLDTLVLNQQELARNNAESPHELSYARAVGEVVANACQNALHDKSAFETLINNNSSEFAKTLRKWIDHLIQTIKKALESVKRYSAEYNALLALDADMKELQRLFNEGLIAKESDTAQSEDTTAKTAGIKYLIRHNEHNVPYVVIEGDYFEGIGLDERRKMLKKSLSEKFPNGVNVGNNLIAINKYTRMELSHSKNTEYYRANYEQKYIDKLNAASNADELLKASRDYINEEPLHIRKDNIVDFGRGVVLIKIIENSKQNNKQVKSREYIADVIVAHTSGETVFLYDIINMNEINIAEVEKTGKHDNIANASSNLASTNNSISNSAENVKENSENEKSSYREFKGSPEQATREQLEKTLAVLEEQFKLTHGERIDRKALRGFIKDLTKRYPLAKTFDVNKATDYVLSLFEQYHNGLISISALFEQVNEYSEGLIDFMEDFVSEEGEALLDYLHRYPVNFSERQKVEIRHRYGDLKSFTRSIFGTVSYKKDASLLDGMWSELSTEFPWIFPEDTVDLDQPFVLADAIEEAKTPLHISEITDVKWLANKMAFEILKQYEVAPIYKTFADKAEEKRLRDIERLKADFEAQKTKFLAKQANASGKLMAKILKGQNKVAERMIKRAVAEEMKEGKARLREYRRERKATAEKRANLATIESVVSDLLKWTNSPKQNKSVPTELQADVLELISTINLESGVGARRGNTQHDTKWQAAIGNVLERLSKESKNEATLFVQLPTAFVESFKEFIKSANISEAESIYDLDARDIEYIASVLKMVKGTIQGINKAYAEERTVYISDLAKKQINENEKQTSKGVRLALGSEFFTFDQMDSYTYAKVLGGTAESTIIKNLQKGQDRQIELLKIAINAFADISKDTEWKKWFGRNAQVNEYQLESGSISLTTGQLISLYLTAEREQGVEHILGSGISPDKRDFEALKLDERIKPNAYSSKIERLIKKYVGNISPETITESDLAELLSNVTEEQRAFGIKLRDFLSNEVAEWGNEVTQKLWLYDGYTERKYWTIQTNKDFTATKNDDVQKASLWAIKNQSFTKQLVKGANNPIIITDALQLWVEHISNMATYNAYTLPIADAMRWFNFNESTPLTKDGTQRKDISVKDSMNKAYGDNAAKYFINLVKDINGTTERERGVRLFKKLTKHAKAQSVGFNLRVAIQQFVSYLRAGMVIDYKYLTKALKDKSNIALSKEYCPIAWWKSQGFFSTDVGPGMYELITGDKSTTNNVRDSQMWLAGMADEVTWGALWNAVAYEIADTTDLKKGSEEFNKAVGARLADVINQTQVVDSVFHRSQGMRGNSLFLTDIVYTFATEQNKTYNVIMRAAVDSHREGNPKAFIKAVVVSLVTQFAAQAAASLISALRDDDEDEEWLEKYIQSFSNTSLVGELLSSIPLVDKLISIIEGYASEPLAFGGFKSAFNASKYAAKFFAEYDEMSPTEKRNNSYRLFYTTAKAISSATGIAASNILRELKGIYNLMADKKIGKGYKVTDKYEILREAMVTGDTKKYDKTYDRLIEDGKTDEDIQSGIKTSIKNNDERIQEAVEAKASAQTTGDYDKLYGIIDSIAADGFDRQMIVDIVNSAFNTYAKDKDELLTGKYADLITSVNKGWANNARKIVKEFQEQGVKPETIRSSVTQGVKPYYFELKYKAIQGDTSAKEELSDLKKNLRGLELGYKYDTFTGWDKEYIVWRKEKYGR